MRQLRTDIRGVETRRLILLVDLLIVAAVCIGFRAFRLEDQSVWLDDYFSAAYLDAPDLVSNIAEQRGENWEMVPLYYALEYLWGRTVGGGIPGVRWLSILFSTGAALLTYGAGRAWFGRWAGLTAALLFALSPAQIFHGQGLRPYALMVLLGAGSCYAFVAGLRARDRRSGWWLAANAGCNVLLVWTHLFAPLLAVAQGAAFLILRGRWWRRWFAWGAGQALLLAPVLVWVAGIRVVPGPDLPPPGWEQATALMTGYDIGYINWVVFPPEKLDEAGVPDAFRQMLEARRFFADWLELALTAAAGAALLVLCARLWRDFRAGGGLRPRTRALAFLFVWWAVPFALLWALAQAWAPTALQGRYVIYSVPALYLLAGSVAQAARWWHLQSLATAVLVALMGFQAYATVQLPMRNDHMATARALRETAPPGAVAVVPDYNICRVLQFNLGPNDYVFLRPPDPAAQWQTLDALNAQQKRFWIVLAGTPAMDESVRAMEQWLDQHGITFRRRAFLGQRNLYLYEVRPGEPTASAPTLDPAESSRL